MQTIIYWIEEQSTAGIAVIILVLTYVFAAIVFGVVTILSRRGVAEELKSISPVTLTPAIRAQLNLSTEKGVMLATVSPNSPAAAAGLQERDIVTQADGKPVTTEQELRQAIQAHKIGDTISLTVVRNGQTTQLNAKLAEAPPPS